MLNLLFLEPASAHLDASVVTPAEVMARALGRGRRQIISSIWKLAGAERRLSHRLQGLAP